MEFIFWCVKLLLWVVKVDYFNDFGVHICIINALTLDRQSLTWAKRHCWENHSINKQQTKKHSKPSLNLFLTPSLRLVFFLFLLIFLEIKHLLHVVCFPAKRKKKTRKKDHSFENQQLPLWGNKKINDQ